MASEHQIIRNSFESNTSTLSPSQPPSETLNVVLEHIDGTAELYRKPYEQAMTGRQIFEKVKKEMRSEISWMLRLLCFLGLVSVTAYIAEYTLDVEFTESQAFPAGVVVQKHRLHRSFTNAFSKPTILETTERFVTRYRTLTTSSTSNEALVFRLVINKMVVFWVLFASFVAAPLLGLAVGFACQRPGLGMETSNAIFTMIPAVVALGAWVQGFNSGNGGNGGVGV